MPGRWRDTVPDWLFWVLVVVGIAGFAGFQVWVLHQAFGR